MNQSQDQPTIVDRIEQLGAVALTGLAMLVSVEMVLEHAPAGQHGGHAKHASAVHEVLARGESKGETARLPEEFDVGLQTPDIAGT